MKVAILDLGTNTFHLLIARVEQSSYEVLSRTRKYVYLAQDDIGHISPAAQERAYAAIHSFREILDKENIDTAKISSTAALRTAQNGPEIATEIEAIIGYPVDIISGDREAELIYKGVALIHKFDLDSSSLIMDIGGGSVEFILVNGGQVAWAKSYPIGIAVLRKKFQKGEIISSDEIERLQKYLNETLGELDQQIKSLTPVELVGASGTFDVIQQMLGGDRATHLTESFDFAEFDSVYESLISCSMNDRINLHQVPEKRADLIQVALLLIKHLRQYPHIAKLSVSAYALKEGLLSEIMDASKI